MSLKTWKAEFYSEPTEEMTKKAAIEHSIKKWIGLRPENLAKHECYFDKSCDWVVRDDNTTDFLLIDSGTCALCVKYLSDGDLPCLKCPLYKSLGYRCDGGITSPFVVWLLVQDPEPMIEALQGLLK